MPFRATITEGTKADCKEVLSLVERMEGEALFRDWAFDVIEEATIRKMEIVISPKKE